MHAMIFVNLPVADIDRSRTFSSDTALTLMLGENQFAMLLQRDSFDSLHPVETADASKTKECVVRLGVDSRDEVDALVDRAITTGGTPGDTEDHAFMYGRSYNDPDGHSWQIFWMDPAPIEAGAKEYAAQR